MAQQFQLVKLHACSQIRFIEDAMRLVLEDGPYNSCPRLPFARA